MKTSLLLMILVLLLLAVSSPTGRAQMQPPAQAQGDAGLPDFSGFVTVDFLLSYLGHARNTT